MGTNVRRSAVRERTAIAVLLAASLLMALAPIGLRSAAAQNDLAIQTRVQILHASPDLGKVEVHINYDEVVDEFTYGKMSDWTNIAPGGTRVTITQDRAGFNYAVFDAMYPVQAGNDYYLVISDALVLTSAVDRSPITDGSARVRVQQAAVDLPPVNVDASSGNLSLATKLEYARSTEYMSVPAGTYDLNVTLADTGEKALTMPGVVLNANTVYDLVVMGIPGDKDYPLEIRSLSDTPTQQGQATPAPQAQATPTS